MTDLEKNRIRGKVKSLNVKVWYAKKKKDKIKKGSFLNEMTGTYNSNGNANERKYFENGWLSCFDSSYYNSDLNKIVLNFYMPNNFMIYKEMYDYDSLCNISVLNVYHVLKYYDTKTIFNYDSLGNEIEKWQYAYIDKLFDNNKSNLYEYRYSLRPTRYGSTYLYINQKNNTREKRHIDDVLKLINKIQSKYDDKGRIIEQIITNSKYSITDKFTFNYSYNNLEIINFKSKDSLAGRTVLKFDDTGNIIEGTNYDPHNKIEYKITSEYEMDSRFNWIKMIQLEYDKDNIFQGGYIIERTFEYYE